MLARMKLYMIMSDVGWGLWAAIQARISKIDYDFWGWATERWSRAVQMMDSADFERWLRQVQELEGEAAQRRASIPGGSGG